MAGFVATDGALPTSVGVADRPLADGEMDVLSDAPVVPAVWNS